MNGCMGLDMIKNSSGSDSDSADTDEAEGEVEGERVEHGQVGE